MIDDSPQYTESSAAPTEETKETSTENVPKPQDLQVEKDPSARFRGGGTSFKAKLIGVDEVSDSRGDKMCQDSILKLKAAVKASGQHKTKIVVNVSLEGLKIIDAMTAIVLHQHPVHKISFIARDLTDRRAFGYVFGDVGGKHEFFGIKTAKVAEHLVLALRDLFQVVYEMKKLEMEKIKIKAQAEEATTEDVYAVPNNKPLQQTSAQGNGNLFEIEAQLQNMNQISQIDAFNKPWPENAPMSPDTPGSPTNDMFGMNLSDISSLSSDFSMASASSAATDHSRPIDVKSQFLDSRSTQVQHFHRTSSSKSTTSWHGSTGPHLSGFHKSDSKIQRRGSVSSLKNKIVTKVNTCIVPADVLHKSLNKAEAKSAQEHTHVYQESNYEISSVVIKSSCGDHMKDQKSADNSKHEELSNVLKYPVATNSTHDSKDHHYSDSFFNEVMEATGIPSTSLSTLMVEDKHNQIRKTSDTMNEMSGSLSSLSSSNSKASTPKKSLSISNLFFSKSDKNKTSIKRNKKLLSRQSSGASITSVTDKVNTVAIANDPKISGIGGSAGVLSSNPSVSIGNIQRKSSSSSSHSERAAHLRLSGGYSSTSLASDSGNTELKSPQERIPPPASAARARPRPNPNLTAKVYKAKSHNPPMFKTKPSAAYESEENAIVSSNQSSELAPNLSSLYGDMTASAKEFDSGYSEAVNITAELQTDTEQEINTSESWACFDNEKINDGQNTLKSEMLHWFNDDSEGKSKTDIESSVWSAFGNQNYLTETKVDVHTPHENVVKDTTASNLFGQDHFGHNAVNFYSGINKHDSPERCTSSVFSNSPFENYDPFGDIVLEDPLQDPLQNIEDFFCNTGVATEKAKKADYSEHSSSDKEEDIFRWTGNTLNCGSFSSLPFGEATSVEIETFDPDSKKSDMGNNATLLNYDNTVAENNGNFESTTCDAVLSPPAVPPRFINYSDEVHHHLPPLLPPPPLPTRVALNEAESASSDEKESVSNSDGHLYAFPPDCKPPQLPLTDELFVPVIEVCSITDSPPIVPSRSLQSSFASESSTSLHKSNDISVIECMGESLQVLPIRRASKSSSVNPISNSSVVAYIDTHDDDDEDKNESSNMQNSRNDSYTNDLAALSMNAIQPVGSAGAKLTKDQILAGFGQDVPASNPYQQQPQQQIPGFFSPQQPVYSPPQQPMYRAPAPVAMANPFAAFAVAPQEQSAMGMFPPGPSPAIPSRPGAMRPPTTVLAQTGAAQNPFGDTLGSGNSGIGGLLAPVNSQPDLLNSQKVEKKPNDPFAGLVPDIGNKPPPTNKKDMFKNFQMAKPQPPPRSNDSLSANFDSYMRNSVGGVPVDEASNNSIQTIPKPAPRSASQDLFNSTPVVNKGNANVTTDPFAAFGSSSGGFDQAFNFDAQNQGNNSQPLFG